MKKVTIVFIFFFTSFLSSQTNSFNISGTLVAEDGNFPLESATVYLQRVIDSTLITYTISDRNGEFTLENKTTDKKANLYISYVGYQTYSKVINLDKEFTDLGKIKMQINTEALDEIVIKSTAPITIKRDTLEFNVKSFKTRKDANVEDLLKELPGVEVDEEGNIQVNGKPVNRIFVNGKPFFGDDPTITTRSLTKDIVEKIQILDTKTKDQAFTGEEVDGENKTVNLVIKEENNKGVFGRVAAGAGTDNHYEYAGMFNYFDNDRRISFLAGGNDINSPGFSFGEIRQMFGGGNNIRLGSGQGLIESQNFGTNYADKYGEKVDVSANYFYSGSNSENKNISNRENILADSRFFTTSTSNSFNDSDSHNANFEIDIKIDSTLLINIEPSFRYSKSNTQFSEDETSSDEFNALLNQSTLTSNVETFGKNFSNEIDVTKRFGSNGAFLRLSLDNEINVRERDDFLNSETNIFGENPEDVLRNQYTDGENKVDNLSSRLTYRLPLIGKEFFVEFQYRYDFNKQEDKKSTFDLDTDTQEYSNFNIDLSTDFEYINEANTPSVEFEYRKKDWSASMEASYVFRTLENKDMLRPEFTIQRDFEAVELRSRFRYRFSPQSSLRVGYNLNNNPPRLSQLQAFRDVSNPLNTVVGNPNLEPENNHRVYARYNNFNFQKGFGFYGFFRATIDNNTVVRKTVIDENLVRETTFANVNGNYDVNGYVSVSKKVKIDSLRTLNFDVGIGPNIRRTINFNNDVQYASNNTSLSPRLGMRFIWKDVLEFNPRYRLSYTQNTFDIENFDDQEFISHSLNLNSATFLPKGFEWRNDVSFNYNPNVADGFQKSAWFWNATLAYSVLKNKGTVTLKAYDLLNQNTNARRIATQNYIEDVESTVLQQYFMLSFSWKFNSLGSAAEDFEDGGRRQRYRRG
ncbi:outer membrane receptor protein involved in Fe transport [Jejuia pallidilutea]|uniref:Outer membrane receptor protein involved in Fe transport n=1 Tax=Jejuia pallidilutea TaxID=504487 RepID=A0A362XDH9_9FLAO|nr:outer membrane beta-barrel protein [Jejuia pallidilutea]PQV51290.1 outer membrane receptor protein involved in Fe transport [Jejuia pallidilutea]